MNRLLVARHDGVSRRVLPGAQTLEAKLSFVIGKGAGNIHGEEQRRDPTNHGASLPQKECWVPTMPCATQVEANVPGLARLVRALDSMSTAERRRNAAHRVSRG